MSTAPTLLRRVLLSGLLTGSVIAANAAVTFAEPSNTPPSTAGGANEPAVQGGQRIYVDPKTGARTAAPAGAAAAPNPALNTSHQGLVEQPAPGGGVMVDLKGRFRSAAVATAGPDGKPSVNCHSPAAPGEKE